VVSGRRDGDSNTAFSWKQTGYHWYRHKFSWNTFWLNEGIWCYKQVNLNNGVRYITNLWFKSHVLCQIWFVEISKTDNRNSVQKKSNAFCREMKHVEPQGSVLGLCVCVCVCARARACARVCWCHLSQKEVSCIPERAISTNMKFVILLEAWQAME